MFLGIKTEGVPAAVVLRQLGPRRLIVIGASLILSVLVGCTVVWNLPDWIHRDRASFGLLPASWTLTLLPDVLYWTDRRRPFVPLVIKLALVGTILYFYLDALQTFKDSI